MKPLEEYAEQVAAFVEVCHRLARNMYVTSQGGNLAWRLEPDLVLITPTQVNKSDVEAADVVFINLAGEIVAGQRRPTGETPMYLTFFKKRPDIESVIHCHPPAVCAMAIVEGKNWLMRPLYPETTFELGPVPMVPYGEPLTETLAKNFEPFLPKYNSFLMENHGLVTMSRGGILWTMGHVELLELSAQSVVMAMQMGKIKEMDRQAVIGLGDVMEKRKLPLCGAPGVNQSLESLYFDAVDLPAIGQPVAPLRQGLSACTTALSGGTGETALFAGEIALVTGGASGIGKACVESLLARGAAVVSMDINPAVKTLWNRPDYLGLQCDLTDEAAVVRSFEALVKTFGGLDMLVLNAGIFPAGCRIESLTLADWQRVMRINLDSNVVVMREAQPLLKNSPRGGRVLVNASKNVLAPGVGAAAYSASKAAVTQLARVAALEWGKDRIRVNLIHPDAVFDSGIWTEEVLKARAAHYGLTVQQYKTRNVLGVELNCRYVGELVAEMLGPRFEKITGAQIPVDGGSDRVI